MTSKLAKKASAHLPYCEDQGIPYLAAAGLPGVGVLGKTFTMDAPGVFTFATQGLPNMETAVYQVLIQNQSDVADEATVSAKATTGFTITGPDVADVLDIIIVGRLAGQVA